MNRARVWVCLCFGALIALIAPTAGAADSGSISQLRAQCRLAARQGDTTRALSLCFEALDLHPAGSPTRLWELYQVPQLLVRLERHCEARDAAHAYLRAAPLGDPELQDKRRRTRTLMEQSAVSCETVSLCPGPDCPRQCPGDPGCPPPAPSRPYRGTLTAASGLGGGRRLLTRLEATVGYQPGPLRFEAGVAAVVEPSGRDPVLIFRPGIRIDLSEGMAGPYVRGAGQLMVLSLPAGGTATSLGGLVGAGWGWLLGPNWGVLAELDGSIWGASTGAVRTPLGVRVGVYGAL